MLFKVIIRPDIEDGGFNVSCPALPGCHSQGDTEEEAIKNIKDAIIGCLEALNQRAQIHGESEKVIEVALG
jgi:predicted RNase H-like HicB family nuclease